MRLKVLIFISIIIFSCKTKKNKLKRDLIGTENLIGLYFSQSERDSLLPDLILLKDKYESIRSLNLSNSIPLPLHFNRLVNGHQIPKGISNYKFEESKVNKPFNIEICAFYTIDQLSYLIRTKKIKSEDLTKMYINRLRKFGSQLECVITITEKMALKQAKKADIEIQNGFYRGPLHGIPYGVKDLLSVRSYKTTWGANTHKEQIINETATVLQKLEESGAVLIAKLALGALTWGDVWFGGKTRNPWSPSQGSSGSSAGPGSATATFDKLTRNNRDEELVCQEKMSWPNTFRRARYIPAVEYI